MIFGGFHISQGALKKSKIDKNVTIGKPINHGNKYHLTIFNNTILQLIFYHDVRSKDEYFTPGNVRHFIGQYRYSLLSDLETKPYYKINDKYEFLIHYPELTGNSYNWWRQNLSPTIQTENETKSNENDHYVLGYEKIDVHFTDFNWGGLSLSRTDYGSYINGDINHPEWHYAIGCYGTHEKGILGPSAFARYSSWVALYARINDLNMIKCETFRNYLYSFLNLNTISFVFVLL